MARDAALRAVRALRSHVVFDRENTMKFAMTATLAGGVALVLVLAMTFSYGRDARLKIEQAETATSEEESRAFCRDAGFAPESEAHVRCMTRLREIQLRHRERWEADASGIL